MKPASEPPVAGALLRLALPVLASQLLRLAYQWVDALWVRSLGVEATAAVTTSVFVMWAVYSLNDMVSIGVMAYVAQLVGAGERRRAGVAAWHGLRATAGLGLAAGLTGLFAAGPLFRAIAPDPALAAEGARYLRVVMAGAPLPMLALTCESVMRASGDTRTPLLLDLCAVLLNAALDPLLIFGLGPFPALGVAGAAWATVCAQALLVGGYLLLALRRHPALPLARRAPGAPVKVAGLMRVGLPAALIGLLFSAVYVAFARSAARFGAAAMAVVGVANRIEAILFVLAAAVGAAGASLVGQSLGAGRPERAAQVIRTGVAWSVWLSTALMLALLAGPGAFLGLFTRDTEALRLGVPYLRVLALCFVPTAIEVVTAESVLGSGHTVAISWIYTAVSLARIPLAFLVPDWTGSGIVGIAWLITVTCWLRTALIVAWVARGSWRRGLRDALAGGAPAGPSGTA